MISKSGFSFVRATFLMQVISAVFILSAPINVEAFSLLNGLVGKKTNKEVKNSQTVPLPKANLALDQNSQGGGDITIVGNSALLPDAGVLGTSADIVYENSSGEISIYIVRKGDTISGIAKMFDVSANTIIWANDIKRGIISEGQELVILPISGVQYTIKDGDTPKKIATKYKADVDEFLKFNGISLETKLIAGEILIIPDVETSLVNQSPSNQLPTSRIRGASGPDYAGYYRRPVSGGYRSQGLHGYNGVDLAGVPAGTPVVAAASGDVIISREGWNGGYGNYVVIQHPNGTQTLYGHLRSNVAVSGYHVEQGQVIGYVGSTGRSTGTHLHFEIRGAKNPF